MLESIIFPLLKPFIEDIAKWLNNKKWLNGVVWKSIMLDIEKYFSDSIKIVTDEFNNVKTLAIQSMPEAQDLSEDMFSVISEYVWVNPMESIKMGSQWRRDFFQQFIEERIVKNFEFLKLKERMEIRGRSLVKIYQEQMLKYIKAEQVDRSRLIKEKTRTIEFVKELMTILTKLFKEEVYWHLCSVQADLWYMVAQHQVAPFKTDFDFVNLMDEFFQKMIDRISNEIY